MNPSLVRLKAVECLQRLVDAEIYEVWFEFKKGPNGIFFVKFNILSMTPIDIDLYQEKVVIDTNAGYVNYVQKSVNYIKVMNVHLEDFGIYTYEHPLTQYIIDNNKAGQNCETISEEALRILFSIMTEEKYNHGSTDNDIPF
jgi:hypothetical protein